MRPSTLGLVLLLAAAGCRSTKVEHAAAGQPTMNELMHRRTAERLAKDAQWRQTFEQAQALTPTEVRNLERSKDTAAHEKLAMHYQQRNDERNRTRQVLWLVEHAPSPPLLYIDPATDPAGFERGRRLWRDRAYRAGASPEIVVRAAQFISSGDKPEAEKLLTDFTPRNAEDRRAVSTVLGGIYADTLTGSFGPKPLGVIRAVRREEARGTYAASVREKLESTTDAALLLATAHSLLREAPKLVRNDLVDFDPVALARRYVDRAQSLEPESPQARRTRDFLAAVEDSERLARLLADRTPEQALAAAQTASDRLLILRATMQRSYLSDLPAAEKAAAQLIRSAGSSHADLLYEANIVLGKVALRRGDRRAAADYLRAAGEAAASDEMAYATISMELPRALVDWGERSTVAAFLETCAKRNYQGEQLRKWAAEIRSGINPDLIPFTTGCSQDPC